MASPRQAEVVVHVSNPTAGAFFLFVAILHGLHGTVRRPGRLHARARVPTFRPFACARSRAPVSAVRARILPVRAGVAWRVVFVAWRVLAVHARISQLEFSLHGAFLNHFFGRERAVVWSGRWSISFPI